MKKLLLRINCILVTLMCCLNILNVYADDMYSDMYRSPETNRWHSSLDAADNLFRLDIVRDYLHWQSDEKITRREAFKMAYIIKEHSRDYIFNENDDVTAYFENESYVTKNLNKEFNFADVEKGSTDYYFVASLFETQLLSGRLAGNELVAELDEFMTYGEACATIFRLFIRNSDIEKDMVEHDYYDFLVESNLR